MNSYTVEFRIEDVSLAPKEITKILKLSPCQTRDTNTNINKKNHNALWAYDGVNFSNDSILYEWRTLEEGLNFLLDKLEPKLYLIKSNFNNYKKYFWCAHFQEDFDSSIRLSPNLLKRLVNFDAELIINNYCSIDE